MRINVLICVGVLSVSGAALAGDSWIEMFYGMGAAGDREAACGSAESNARMSSASACMARRGYKSDDSFNCSCQTSGSGDSTMYTCNGTLKVRCSK